MLLKFFCAVYASCRNIFRFPLLVTLERQIPLRKSQRTKCLCPLPAAKKRLYKYCTHPLVMYLEQKSESFFSLQVNGQTTQQLYEQLFTAAFKTLPGQQSLQQLTDTNCPQPGKQNNMVCHLSLLTTTSLWHWKTSPGKPWVTAVLFFFGALLSVHSQIIEV